MTDPLRRSASWVASSANVTCRAAVLLWMWQSTRVLAKALRENGHQVSKFVVARLVKALGYSLAATPRLRKFVSTWTGTRP